MADQQFIQIRGARENNLKNVSLDIPKQRITVFTGVSGSGKSSLVFDTIAAEAQRQLNETFTAFVQGFLPHYGQPDVDRIEHLNAPIIIDQKRVGGGSRSTLGTYTDIAALLRLLFSRVGSALCGPAFAFSFNTPQGMCPECEGIGKTVQLDLDKFLDRSKSLNGGAILHPEFKVGKWMWKMYPLSGLFDLINRSQDYTEDELHALLHGADIKVSFGRFGSKYEGLVERFTRMYLKKDAAAMSERNRAVFEQFTTTQTCPVCQGARLNQAALNCRIDGRNIADSSDLEATELISVLQDLTDPVAIKVAAKLSERVAAPDRYRPGLSQPRPRNRHAFGRRVAARQDDPAPGQQPDRHAVHPRRTQRGPARPRRGPPDGPAAETARQRQYGTGGRARPGRDRDGRPHRGYRAAGRHARR